MGDGGKDGEDRSDDDEVEGRKKKKEKRDEQKEEVPSDDDDDGAEPETVDNSPPWVQYPDLRTWMSTDSSQILP